MSFRVSAQTNVAMQLVSIAVLVILIVCQLASEYKHTKENKVFLLLLCLAVAVLGFDAMAWGFNKAPGQHITVILQLANLAEVILAVPVGVVLLAYIAFNIPVNKKIEHKICKSGVWVSVIYAVLVCLLQINGLIFYINEENRYKRGPLSWLPSAVFLILTLGIIVLIIYNKKPLGKRKSITLLSYPTMQMAAVFFYLMVPHGTALQNIYFALSLLIIFVNIQMQQEKKMMQQEGELLESKVAVMLSQIQPHFLYNSLAAIYELCYKDPECAGKAVLEFSKYLRINMDSLSEKQLIPFQKELDHTKHYLWLESLRFGKRLQIEYDIQLVDFKIPPLTLQPIVENAVRYGITSKNGGGTVTIKTEEQEEGVCITVKDDGIGFNVNTISEGRSHIGIHNVRGRLKMICGGRLDMESEPGNGTIVKIVIPKEGA